MASDQPDTSVNRERQRELYGVPLAERVHRLTAALGVTQARLAATLGLSPAMLSQLVSGRRVKIGDPAVLSRLIALDERCARGPVRPDDVPALLEQVHAAKLRWSSAEVTGTVRTVSVPAYPVPLPRRPRPTADDALRGVSPPARLVAAAAALATSFPEIAEVLRRAASRPVR